MSDLSHIILEKIQTEKVKPTPKWVFLLKRSSVWGLFVLSVLIGSAALGLVFFQFQDADYASFHRMGHGPFEFVLLALPYFWVALMASFVILAFYNFRHTEEGYKYGVFAIVGLSLLSSLILGSAFYASGYTEKLDGVLNAIPHYEDLNFGKRILWQRPEEGFLAGTILRLDKDQVLVLQDFGNKTWWVNIGKAEINPPSIVEVGARIKAVGERQGPDRFDARLVTPWRYGERPPFPPPPSMDSLPPMR
jgi:hypothetical protein